MGLYRSRWSWYAARGSGAAQTARNSGTRLTSMARPAPIWETAAHKTSAGREGYGLTFCATTVPVSVAGDVRRSPSDLVAHLAAHLRQKAPLGGGGTLDAARRDLVQHPVALRLRGGAHPS